MGQSSKSRIARNSVFLYLRLILVTGAGLYTSRIVLEALGETDFGVFNLAGSLIAFFSVLNTAMSGSIQRFLSYFIGKNEITNYNSTINIGIKVHVLIALAVMVLAETIGLWIFSDYLNIPQESRYASHFVYQFSLFATIATIIGIPYNGLIVAWEKMDFFAYLAIIEVVLKLAIAFAIKYYLGNRLILYSALYFVATILPVICMYGYCKRNIGLPKYQSIPLKSDLSKKVFSFSLWSFLGNASTVIFWQGISILINLFYGVILNAALAITNQVTGAVSKLISSFQMAYKPAIIKEYANSNRAEFLDIISKSAKFSFFLLYLACFPLILNTDYITSHWLTEVPEYTNVFIRILLISLMLNSLSIPFLTAIEANGNIRTHQLACMISQILPLPIAYIMLKLDISLSWVISLNVVVSLTMLAIKLIILKKLIDFPIRSTLTKVFLPMTIVVLLSFGTYLLIPIGQSLISIVVCILVAFTSIILFGFSKSERSWIENIVLSKFRNGTPS